MLDPLLGSMLSGFALVAGNSSSSDSALSSVKSDSTSHLTDSECYVVLSLSGLETSLFACQTASHKVIRCHNPPSLQCTFGRPLVAILSQNPAAGWFGFVTMVLLHEGAVLSDSWSHRVIRHASCSSSSHGTRHQSSAREQHAATIHTWMACAHPNMELIWKGPHAWTHKQCLLPLKPPVRTWQNQCLSSESVHHGW